MAAVDSRPHPSLVFGVAIYDLAIGIGAVYVVTDLLLGGPVAGALPAIAGDAGPPAEAIRFLTLTGLGASLGASLHCLFGLYVHACVLENFRKSFLGSYLLSPIAAFLLGVATFLVLQAGLLALGEGFAEADDVLQASLFYSAIGTLVGFSFDAVILRIDGVTRQLFGARPESFIGSALDDAQARIRADAAASGKGATKDDHAPVG